MGIDLAAALAVFLGGPVRIRERRLNPFAGRSLSEILICHFEGGELHLFCKKGSARSAERQNHSRGVPYEAAVYRHLLEPMGASSPKFHGCYSEDEVGTLLVTEYVDAPRLQQADSPEEALVRSAEWIGRFHAAAAGRLTGGRLSFLRVCDAAYFTRWAERTARVAGERSRRIPWLQNLCQRFAELAPLLDAYPRTVIHGEYGPANILVQGGRICPVDWGSAAVGDGTLDLASLTDRCPEPIVRRCVEHYTLARWPLGGAPADLSRRLAVARVYWLLRRLGNSAVWPSDPSSEALCLQLREVGEHIGLVSA